MCFKYKNGRCLVPAVNLFCKWFNPLSINAFILSIYSKRWNKNRYYLAVSQGLIKNEIIKGENCPRALPSFFPVMPHVLDIVVIFESF